MRLLRWWLFFLLSFYLCGLLTVLPIPSIYEWYRPLWLLMFVIYCQVVYPKYFNPIYAWFIGLMVDALLGTRLGEHALVFALISYFTAFIRQRFVGRPLGIQLGKVGMLVCLGQILILWFHVFAGQNPHTLLYWVGTLSSCIFWPFFVGLLNGFSKMLSVAPYPSRSM